MVAIERIKEYSEVPSEAPEFVEPRPAASWPSKGKIAVEDLVLRYAVSFAFCSPRSSSDADVP